MCKPAQGYTVCEYCGHEAVLLMSGNYRNGTQIVWCADGHINYIQFVEGEVKSELLKTIGKD